MQMRSPLPLELIERHIYSFRRRKVVLDHDLVKVFRVPVTLLRQTVRRHKGRFPKSFAFRLTSAEAKALGTRRGTCNRLEGRCGRSPYAFTEAGILMLSGVLKSDRAVQVSIELIRSLFSVHHIF